MVKHGVFPSYGSLPWAVWIRGKVWQFCRDDYAAWRFFERHAARGRRQRL